MTQNSKNAVLFSLVGLCVTFFSLPGMADGQAITAAELAGATYQGIDEGSITLQNGRWEGEPYVEGGASRPAAGLVGDFVLSGDLNGDGINESVVLIWQSSGGSGTFRYLAVMERDGDQVKNLGMAELGDRVKVRGGRIDGELIVLDVLQQGEGDAACCPTQLATRSWLMIDGQLVEGDINITGTLSPK